MTNKEWLAKLDAGLDPETVPQDAMDGVLSTYKVETYSEYQLVTELEILRDLALELSRWVRELKEKLTKR